MLGGTTCHFDFGHTDQMNKTNPTAIVTTPIARNGTTSPEAALKILYNKLKTPPKSSMLPMKATRSGIPRFEAVGNAVASCRRPLLYHPA